MIPTLMSKSHVQLLVLLIWQGLVGIIIQRTMNQHQPLSLITGVDYDHKSMIVCFVYGRGQLILLTSRLSEAYASHCSATPSDQQQGVGGCTAIAYHHNLSFVLDGYPWLITYTCNVCKHTYYTSGDSIYCNNIPEERLTYNYYHFIYRYYHMFSYKFITHEYGLIRWMVPGFNSVLNFTHMVDPLLRPVLLQLSHAKKIHLTEG